uniref:CSON010054 protein n=1 Tax=Culicoides sonorensis TaxID=179676 RepID=A0A336N3L3_CULSO
MRPSKECTLMTNAAFACPTIDTQFFLVCHTLILICLIKCPWEIPCFDIGTNVLETLNLRGNIFQPSTIHQFTNIQTLSTVRTTSTFIEPPEMDILKPDLIWIGSRCYRVNPTSDLTVKINEIHGKYIEQDDFDQEDDETLLEPESENQNNSYQIESINGRYSTSFHVPSQLFGQIVGAKGATRRRIETETGSQILIPKQGQEGDIRISSNNPKNVQAARRRIEIIVIGARAKIDFTHFLSVPLIDPLIQKNYKDFKTKILSDPKIYGISEKHFQNPNKLHLTVVCLTLLDNTDRSLAAQYLQECRELIVNPILADVGQLELEMRGLGIMNDDPSAVNVLYGTVDCEPLQVICDKIYEYFVGKGMCKKQYDRVKLHATLMNTKFIKSREDSSTKNNKADSFDATQILENYRNFYFGKMQIRELLLSQRHTTGSNNYYETSCMIKI